ADRLAVVLPGAHRLLQLRNGLTAFSGINRRDALRARAERRIGWATLLAISGNLVTISSRSFGVADKIKSGLGVAGPVIDNYANL
ncbi:hypothetical protein ONO57_26685, partial [Salmonella enterica subsp. enterica serovar Anatum]|nr:hypothetical protein [Salmonella enterica subsp. enterica serovar Anatum]